jgi:hypothetical protein
MAGLIGAGQEERSGGNKQDNLVSVVPDSSIIVDDGEDVLDEYELVSWCDDVGEGQNVRMVRNGHRCTSLHINMGLTSRICITGITGYHWHCSCYYHSLILIAQHKASETNWFKDFQDTDAIMIFSFIEVGTECRIITSGK